MKQISILVMAILASSYGISVVRSAHAQGFDCAKAADTVEQVICSNSELRVLEGRLNSTWRSFRESHPDLFREQAAAGLVWWKQRKHCGVAADPVGCIRDADNSRIRQIVAADAAAYGLMPPPRAEASATATAPSSAANGEASTSSVPSKGPTTGTSVPITPPDSTPSVATIPDGPLTDKNLRDLLEASMNTFRFDNLYKGRIYKTNTTFLSAYQDNSGDNIATFYDPYVCRLENEFQKNAVAQLVQNQKITVIGEIDKFTGLLAKLVLDNCQFIPISGKQ